MKVYLRLRTWILVAILILGTFGVSLILKSMMPDNTEWKTSLEQRIKSNQDALSAPGVPEFAKKEIERTIAIDQYALDHNINQGSMWKTVKDLSGLLQLITIFVVIIVGDMVAGEFTWGTIKLLLIRPVSRTKILLSKYISTILFALFLMAILFISAIVISGFLFGFGDIGTPHLYFEDDGSVQEGSMLANALQTYGLSAIQLIMIVTIAFMISTVFRSSSMAIGLSIFIMFTGSMIAGILIGKFSWGKYLLFANTDLTPYLEGTPAIEGMTLGFSITVLLVHFVILNLISWFIFNKRDVAA